MMRIQFGARLMGLMAVGLLGGSFPAWAQAPAQLGNELAFAVGGNVSAGYSGSYQRIPAPAATGSFSAAAATSPAPITARNFFRLTSALSTTSHATIPPSSPFPTAPA